MDLPNLKCQLLVLKIYGFKLLQCPRRIQSSVLGLRGLQSPVATKNTPRVRHAPVIGNATGFALSGWYCCTGTYDTTMAKLGDSWSKRSWILVSPLAIRWWRSSPQNHLRLIQKYPKINPKSSRILKHRLRSTHDKDLQGSSPDPTSSHVKCPSS